MAIIYTRMTLTTDRARHYLLPHLIESMEHPPKKHPQVVQRLIPQLPTLENLLNYLISACKMEVGAWARPAPVRVDTYNEIVRRRRWRVDHSPPTQQSHTHTHTTDPPKPSTPEILPLRRGLQDLRGDGLESRGHAELRALLRHDRRRHRRLVHLRVRVSGTMACSASLVVFCFVGKMARGVGLGIHTYTHLPSPKNTTTKPARSVKYDAETGEAVEGSPYDADSASVIRLSNGMVLYLREVDE